MKVKIRFKIKGIENFEGKPNYYLIILPRRKTISNPLYGFIKDYKDTRKAIFYLIFFQKLWSQMLLKQKLIYFWKKWEECY